MAQVLVRNLDDDTVTALKVRARQHHRSLQGEIKTILEDAARAAAVEDFRRRAEEIRRSFGSKKFSNSAELIRRNRER